VDSVNPDATPKDMKRFDLATQRGFCIDAPFPSGATFISVMRELEERKTKMRNLFAHPRFLWSLLINAHDLCAVPLYHVVMR
jgi:hypothetical protein